MRSRILPPMASLVLVWGFLLAAPTRALCQEVDLVIEWNRIVFATLTTPGALPPTIFFTRPPAIVHAAVFDALNSFDALYTPYAVRVDVPAGASRDAAVAQAAHDVLVALFPAQQAGFDAALAATLGRLSADAARGGAQVGAAAAKANLELRASDGWTQVPPPYINPDLPGYWQPVPPANAPAGYTHYPNVLGFIVGSRSRLLVEPPPVMTGAHYAADFNEVKSLGSATSTTRTAEQTQVARLWAGVGTTTTPPSRVWNNVAVDQIRSRRLSGLEAARLLALLNMTEHDALLGSFTGKYLYGLWRPTTAIREAARDGNSATEADPNWLSLLPTPPYPSYPGNMACLGASSSRLLARFLGRDDIAFAHTWVLTDGTNVTRSYAGFRQMGDEAAKSRIWGGIHYEFDTLASFGVCTPLADYAIDNYLRARFTP